MARIAWFVFPFLLMLAALALVIWLCGQNPATALEALWRGAFGSMNGLASTAARSVVLICYALGIVLNFRTGILNIGAEGQSRMGAALATALVTGSAGSMLAHLSVLGIALALLAGAAMGAAWSLIAGLLRHWRGVPEVISTLMLNFIALLFVKYLVSSPLFLRGEGLFHQSGVVTPDLQLLGWGRTEFHSGVFFAIPAVILLQLYLFHTRGGFQLRALGYNPAASATCGIPVRRVLLKSFIIGGALAGFAGALGILARGRLDSDPTYPDYGYMAIAVALLADLKPLWVLPSAIFFAGLEVGTRSMERNAGVSHDLIYFIEGFIILAVLLRGFRGFSKTTGAAEAPT